MLGRKGSRPENRGSHQHTAAAQHTRPQCMSYGRAHGEHSSPSATSYHPTCTVGVCVVLLLCADDCRDFQAARTANHINNSIFEKFNNNNK